MNYESKPWWAVAYDADESMLDVWLHYMKTRQQAVVRSSGPELVSPEQAQELRDWFEL
jgi:hypothetical protein